MIKKLRFRLIAVSMISLLIVLTAIVGGVNLMNYQGIVEDADSVLALLSLNKGSLSESLAGFEWQKTGPRYRSPELIFEIRFFSALVDSDGQVLSADIDMIAALDEATAVSYTQEAFDKGRPNGFVRNYRFLMHPEDENTRVIFLDCGRILASYRVVLKGSIVLSLLDLLAVLILMLLLSGRMIRPVAVSYEKQKRFITDAGHELKTPVSIIHADADLLEMEFGPSEWLDDIRAQSERLTLLTDDLIDLARTEEHGKTGMIEFPLSDVVTEAASSFQSLALTQNLSFSLRIQPMLSCFGNEKSLRRLVVILLDNAMKYADSGGSISLILEQKGKTIVLSVANTVSSIDPETIRCMFDRFYRGDPSRNSGVRGHGVGLSIAKGIAEAHKGRIAADLPDPHTVRVTVTLPA